MSKNDREEAVPPKRSNQRHILDLIERLSGNANVLIIPRALIAMTGDVKAALLLSQCLYWSDKGGKGDGWFYKSRENWEEEIGLTRHEQHRAVKAVEQWVETRLKRAKGAPTLHYRVNMDALKESISNLYPDLLESGKSENRTSIYRKAQVEVSENSNPFADGSKFHLQESGNSLTETTQRSKQKFKQRTRHRLPATAISPERKKIIDLLRQETVSGEKISRKQCEALSVLTHLSEKFIQRHFEVFNGEVIDAHNSDQVPPKVGLLVTRLKEDDHPSKTRAEIAGAQRRKYLDYIGE